MFKKLILMLTLLVSAQSFANSFLTTLPYNIELGKTTPDNLQDKGVCTSGVSRSKCFILQLENENVQVIFGIIDGRRASKFIMNYPKETPTLWKNNGVIFSKVNPEKLNKMAEIFYSEDGTSLLDFYNIIKNTGAENIRTEEKAIPYIGTETTMTFDLENYSYEATFVLLNSRSGYPQKEVGLVGLSVIGRYL